MAVGTIASGRKVRPTLPAARSGRVGPNAVLQLAAALQAAGDDHAERVFRRAGLTRLLSDPPDSMIDERLPQALFDALYRCVDRDIADRVARDAGQRTADYVIAHRIPGPAQRLLPAMPRQIAVRLLLTAIARASWTFAGSGTCLTSVKPDPSISIERNPLTVPGCVWHVAVFERLFERLTGHRAVVVHSACCRDGAPACRFEIRSSE